MLLRFPYARWAAQLLVAGAVFGCGSSSPAPRPARAPSQDPAEQRAGDNPLGSEPWSPVASNRFSLVVLLPDLPAWQIDDAQGQWFVARHVSTGSTLRLRTWNARRLVAPAECEEQARLWLPELPETSGEAAVTRRALKAPEGYHGELVAGVQTVPGQAALEGYVVAMGATIGRCYAAVFTTQASGARADERIGRTLGVAVGGILERIATRGISDRARRPEFPF